MKRAASLLVVSLIVAACATMQSGGAGQVKRGVDAVGGADALASVKTYFEKGTSKYWEPEQSHVAGGEMRFANESNFEAFTDLTTRTTAIDWSRKFAYPAPRTFTFGEIVTPTVGYVSGIDSNGRTKQSQEAKPPAHTMSGLRLAAFQREIRRTSPVLLLEMMKNPGGVTAVSDVTVGGVAYPAVGYRTAEGESFTVLFDRGTGLPARIRTLDYDNMWGDVTYDLVLSDWQTVEGVKVAMTRKYELNGRTVVETKLAIARPNASFAADRLVIPDAFKTAAPRASGAVPYQWVLRRQFIGTYLDSDNPSFDTRASTGLRFVELGKGVQHVVGGSHHSLLVEMKDHLIVFDAPVSDTQSMWVIKQAKEKFPNKPVKYLVMTHHHMDHAGGLRAYAAQGATIVAGKGTAAHYKKLLAAPITRNGELKSVDLSKAQIVEVADKHVFSDGAREVHAYVVENNGHADGLLIGYIPDARLGFATDIWSPGAGPLPEKLTPGMAAIVATVKKAGISPAKFAGGHGATADYAPMAALEGK